jgi:Acyl-CoA synthetase (NDP forming)
MTTPPDLASAEVDVVLADGGVVHLRPIRPDDGEGLLAFHARLSPETRQMRFFTKQPTLSDREVERFTHVDFDRRLALVADLRGEIIAVARYDADPEPGEGAEVAFVVQDEHQGRGIGSILLEHLAVAARCRGITRFHADTLAANQKMQRVFHDAGYRVTTRMESGVVGVEFSLVQTPESVAAIEAREHHAEAASVARLLRPRSIAVVGAGQRAGSIGHELFVNLIRHGFNGPVYPVNPTARSVASVRAWPSITDVPDDIDVAVLAVPPDRVLEVVEQCAQKRVKGLVVISGGFAEVGEEGAILEREAIAAARGAGMRLIGPNCIGIVNTNPDVGMNATFADIAPRRGRVGFLSQSGALGVAVLAAAARTGLGVSTFVSVGNKADISGNDLLQYWEDDPDTDVVLLYLESFGNPRKFSRLARRVSRHKPIVAVKSGRTEIGIRSASSHTAALGSPDRSVDALFQQTGVIRVATLQAMLDVAQVLAAQPLPAGPRVAIVGNSGGPGILAADACADARLELPVLDAGTRKALEGFLSPNAALGNPIDMTAAAGAPEYSAALTVLLDDPLIDAVIVIFTPTVVAGTDTIAEAVAAVAASASKPIVANFLATPAPPPALVEADRTVPYFPAVEEAVAALGAVARYAEWRRRPEGIRPQSNPEARSVGHTITARALAESPEGRWLDPTEVDAMLRAYGIPTIPTTEVDSLAGAVSAAATIDGPVALKAAGDTIIHKTDVGGVALDLVGAEAVTAAYKRMSASLGSAMSGAVVQPMADPGVETIVGITQDPAFGPLVMFGLGGIAAELLGDVTFRVAPLTDLDAAELIREPRSSPLLFGYRGAEPAAVDSLLDLLGRVGALADEQPDIAELDLNPVCVSTDSAVVLDARIRVAPSSTHEQARRLR